MEGVVPFEDRHGNPEGAIFFESSHVVAVQVERLLREQQEFTLSAWIWPFIHKWRGVIMADFSSGSELQLALSRDRHLDAVPVRIDTGEQHGWTKTDKSPDHRVPVDMQGARDC